MKLTQDDKHLTLDAQTVSDLELFNSVSSEHTLFDYCDFTRTKGGAKALRDRMSRPFSEVEKIKSTQAAIGFITKHRNVFARQVSAYAVSRVDQYTHEVLPIVIHKNSIEFLVGAFALWANHDRFFSDIARGVQVSCGFIQTLRKFVDQQQLNCELGELGPLVKEIEQLLSRPNILSVPEEVGGMAFRILRIDQIFRLQEKMAMIRLVEVVYEIDALVALADATIEYGLVMPEVATGFLCANVEGLVHPFIKEAVSNPVNLDQTSRVVFLTGPNMAGKTTYMRAFATALYMAHLGMGVPAKSFRFTAAECLFTSFSLADDLRSGISYFRAEALRVKAIAEAVAAGQRVVALLDEPFKGTNVKDALDASGAILERFSTKLNCIFIISSHLIELGELMGANEQINTHYFEAEEHSGRLQFDYVLHEGVSKQRLGMRVLEEEGIFTLLDANRQLDSLPIDK